MGEARRRKQLGLCETTQSNSNADDWLEEWQVYERESMLNNLVLLCLIREGWQNHFVIESYYPDEIRAARESLINALPRHKKSLSSLTENASLQQWKWVTKLAPTSRSTFEMRRLAEISPNTVLFSRVWGNRAR